VTASTAAAPELRLRRILCAVPPDASSRHAVERAAWLAKACDAEVRLFHALDRRPGTGAPPAGGGAGEDRLLETLLLQAHHLPGRVRLSAAVTVGAPDVEIRRHAALMRADLIVVAVARFDGPTLAKLADLAESSGQPVLAPPPPRDAAAAPRIARLLCARRPDGASAAALNYARALAARIGATVVVCEGSPARWGAADEDAVLLTPQISR
jgi:nucleotide-binding universal stress UspA family protein